MPAARWLDIMLERAPNAVRAPAEASMTRLRRLAFDVGRDVPPDRRRRDRPHRSIGLGCPGLAALLRPALAAARPPGRSSSGTHRFISALVSPLILATVVAAWVWDGRGGRC